MREIKFRAWDGKRMTTSSIMFNNSRGCLEVPNTYSLGAGNIPEDKQMILLQYTGLKDKNNKEIYEGDIINVYGEIRIVTFERGWWMSFTPEQFYELYVDSGCLPAGFATHIDENDYKTIKPLYRYHEPEVIGNIYENKSLLENV